MAEILNFPGQDTPENVIKSCNQELVVSARDVLIGAGWGVESSQHNAELLVAECNGYLSALLSTGVPMKEAMERMSGHGLRRLAQLISNQSI